MTITSTECYDRGGDVIFKQGGAVCWPSNIPVQDGMTKPATSSEGGLGEARQVEVCQDVVYVSSYLRFDKTDGRVSRVEYTVQDEICAKSKKGARDPKADAVAQLKKLVEGGKADCERRDNCRSYREVSEVRTNIPWYTRLAGWLGLR